MTDNPKFPTAIWDGLTPSRDAGDDINPNHIDYDRLAAEIIAIQNHLLALKDALGNVIMTPLAMKGIDPATVTIADLFIITTKDIILPIGGSAVASVPVAYSIPANSVVLGVSWNIESTITLGTATRIALGVAGTLDKYGHVVGGTKNTKYTASAATVVVAADALIVYAVDNSDAAAGTIQNGSVRIRLVFGTQAAVPSAA